MTGTSTRQLDPTVFPPELASNLTSIIQGLVVLFVGADVLILYIWQARKRVGRRITPDEGIAAVSTLAETPVAGALLSRLPRGARALGWAGIVLGLLAFWVSLPPVKQRTFYWPITIGFVAIMLGIAAWSRERAPARRRRGRGRPRRDRRRRRWRRTRASSTSTTSSSGRR